MNPLFPTAYQDGPPGFWEWDIVKQTIDNPVLINTLGYADDQLPVSGQTWSSWIHPDDWGKLIAGLENQVKNRPQSPLIEEVRFFHKTGFIIYILFIGKVTDFSADGSALRMVGSHIDITRQKHNEMDLVRLNSLLNETNRTAMVGGWEFEMATDTLIWTDVTKDIFEVDENFIPKRGDITSLFTEESERERVQAAFNSSVTSGISFDLDFPIISAKRNKKWVRCTCQPAFEDNKCIGLIGVVQDITEKHNAKEALKLKEEQLSTFIKHTPVGICMLDKDLNYIAASDIWKSFFNFGGDDIRGKNQLDIFPETPEIWRERYRSGLKGEVLKMAEDSFPLPDGSVEWLEWEIRPWYELTGQIGGIIIFTSIISEKHAYKQALINAKEAAEQSSLMKSKFLSVISHEMRTPLNAVIGFINLLMQNPRPDQVENMNVLKFSAENLLLLIDDLLDFNKLDADKVRLEVKDFSLNMLVKNIIASFKHEADRKDLDLELVLDPNIPELVGDAGRLSQILTNLINNALKFTHAGGVQLICQQKESREDTVKIGFEVHDTGVGIPSNQLEHIFDMFAQADSGTTRKYGGTGLGLSISKKLLELMGSQIHVSSPPLKGSTFSFEIVFQTGTVSEDQAQDDDETDLSSDVLDGARILIVEDNAINVLLMKKFLTQLKCNCSVAMDGSIACEMVRDNDYDLILMDLQMPVMDGYTSTRNIRNMSGEKYQSIPIIALSATDRSEIEVKLKNVGMTDFISKPFSPKNLNSMLVHYLSKRK